MTTRVPFRASRFLVVVQFGGSREMAPGVTWKLLEMGDKVGAWTIKY